MAQHDRQQPTKGTTIWEWGWAAIAVRDLGRESLVMIYAHELANQPSPSPRSELEVTIPNPGQTIARIDQEVASGHAEEVLRQARALRAMGNEERCTEMLEAFMERLAGESDDVH